MTSVLGSDEEREVAVGLAGGDLDGELPDVRGVDIFDVMVRSLWLLKIEQVFIITLFIL